MILLVSFQPAVRLNLPIKMLRKAVLIEVNLSGRVRLGDDFAFPDADVLGKNQIELFASFQRRQLAARHIGVLNPLEVEGGTSQIDIVELELCLNKPTSSLNLPLQIYHKWLFIRCKLIGQLSAITRSP